MKLNEIKDKQSLEALPKKKYTNGYSYPNEQMNDTIDQYNQLEFGGDVEKLANLLSISFDDVELKDKDGVEKAFHIQQAKYLIGNMSNWLTVRKGDV